VKREDRVARLEALLARVRANTAARGERPRSLLSFRPEPPASETDGPAPFPMIVPSRLIHDEPTLEALSQRAQALTTGQVQPSATPRPTRASSSRASFAATPEVKPGQAIPPPPPASEDDVWPASVRPQQLEPEIAAARDPVIEEPPPIGLERAVREVTADPVDALLGEAALDLRGHERRTTEPPTAPAEEPAIAGLPPEPFASPLPPPPPQHDVAADPFAALDRAFQPAPPPPPPQQPEPGRWTLWAGVAAGALVVLAGMSLLRGDDPPPPKRETVADATPAPEREHVPSLPASHPATPPATQTESAPAPSASMLAAEPILPIPDPPDVSGLGVGRGLLWVESKSAREVFVNGNQAGASGKWLNVPCGLRNVRSAKPGPPPAGASFPMWTSDGHSVLVPCRSYTRVSMPTDP
jgi:hypothetical protein